MYPFKSFISIEILYPKYNTECGGHDLYGQEVGSKWVGMFLFCFTFCLSLYISMHTYIHVCIYILCVYVGVYIYSN